MTGIWTNSGQGWELGSPQPFRDEATLHSLVEESPQFLPLAGAPRLAVLGSEVQLGTGYEVPRGSDRLRESKEKD